MTTNALSKKLSDCYSPHGFYLFLPLFSSTTGYNRGFFPVGSAATQKKSPSVETGVEEGWPAAGELSMGGPKGAYPPKTERRVRLLPAPLTMHPTQVQQGGGEGGEEKKMGSPILFSSDASEGEGPARGYST